MNSDEKENKMEETWIKEARFEAFQCWRDSETKDKVMNPEVYKAVTKKIAFWMETAAQNERNTDYYRNLLIKCGESIGGEAYISDDGSVQKDVLCAKIPELVEAAFKETNA